MLRELYGAGRRHGDEGVSRGDSDGETTNCGMGVQGVNASKGDDSGLERGPCVCSRVYLLKNVSGVGEFCEEAWR